ncbi:MAG: pilus assembly protein N-terminal domain-containing protein [Verrucomicrobia bacterium]|nr:pilus assembly protein N-terminal domain-containing protein [Verrucomicrobiota bacterium]
MNIHRMPCNLKTRIASLAIPLLALPAADWVASSRAAEELVSTNTFVVGEARLVPATGVNVVIATEGIIRAMPAGPGKLVVSAVKDGRTDMIVLDDAGKVTERYQMIVGPPPAPPPPPPTPTTPQKKIKIYEGGKVTEFPVSY